MNKPWLVFLYGPPAVGKLSVAEALAARLPFRVLHNHVTLDPVAEVLPFGTETFWRVVGDFRLALLNAAAREGIDLIYTFVYAPEDDDHVESVVRAYESEGGSVLLVQLTAPRDELLRRVVQPGRQRHGKVSDPATLGRLLDQYGDFTSEIKRTRLRIDLGSTEAATAAELIARRLLASDASGHAKRIER